MRAPCARPHRAQNLCVWEAVTATSGLRKFKKVTKKVQQVLQPTSTPQRKEKVVDKALAVAHDVVAKPIEAGLDLLAPGLGQKFHANVWAEMNAGAGKGRKKRTKKLKRRRRKAAKAAAAVAAVAAAVPRRQRGTKTRRDLRAGRAVAAMSRQALTRAPGRRNMKMRTVGGLNMNSGVISGVTELVPDVNITATDDDTNENIQGFVLYQSQITPQTIAPGTRFAAVASLYDQFDFDSIMLELKPDVPFTENGMIIGGFVADPTEKLPPVADVLNLKKWMEHSNFHTESIANKSQLIFPSDSRAAFKFSPGPKAGFYNNRIPVDATDLQMTSQGQLVVALHTPIGDSSGAKTSGTFSLGPLLLHWRIRLKEAAELVSAGGVEDFHLSNPDSTTTNLFTWTGEMEIQKSLSDQSGMLIPSLQESGQLLFELDVGYYEFELAVLYADTGSAGWDWPYSGDVDGIHEINQYRAIPPLSSTNKWGVNTIRLQVTEPGTYAIFGSTGTSTGWTENQAFLRVTPVPEGSLALLKHPDHKVRSLAMCRLRDETKVDLVAQEVKKQLLAVGLSKKVEPRLRAYDAALRLAIAKTKQGRISRLPRGLRPAIMKRREDFEIDDDSPVVVLGNVALVEKRDEKKTKECKTSDFKECKKLSLKS